MASGRREQGDSVVDRTADGAAARHMPVMRQEPTGLLRATGNVGCHGGPRPRMQAAQRHQARMYAVRERARASSLQSRHRGLRTTSGSGRRRG